MAVRNLSQNLRRRLKRSPAPERSRSRGFTFRLSGLAMLALGVVLVAAVAWAYFMGFMVGRGQNPEQRMSAMLEEKMPQSQLVEPDETLAELEGLQTGEGAAAASAEVPAGDTGDTAAPGAGTDTAAGASAGHGADNGTSPQAQASAGAGKDSQAGPSARQTASAQGRGTAPAGGSPALDMPFARPQGDELAAWGISPQEAAATQNGPQSGSRGTAQAGGAATGQGRQSGTASAAQSRQEPHFDFVFQVAAFKDAADASELRARLEAKGLRTSQKKSGRLVLVLVKLRGTQLDADNVMVEMQRMKLGRPLLASKKAVTGKGRK